MTPGDRLACICKKWPNQVYMLGRCDRHIMSVNGQVGQRRVMEIAADFHQGSICTGDMCGDGVYAIQRCRAVPALVYCPCA